MVRKLRFLILFLLLAGCFEPYEFVVHDGAPTFVVEGSISDKSFNSTLAYPSDGRYFSVKLSSSSDVTNVRPTPYSLATVQLLSSAGEVLPYTLHAPGIYILKDPDFQAKRGVSYKLSVATQDETVFESAWEMMPDIDVLPIGEISFRETETPTYVMESNEWKLRSVKGVSTYIQIPRNTSGTTVFYRMTYAPTWIYMAPLVSQISPYKKCWASDEHYINTYGLQIDQSGGYLKDLFFFPTIRNVRIFEKFSVLVTQHAMTERFYYFWKEMKERNEGGTLLDAPPYNLQTNITATSGAGKVCGYFGVTREQATRWYFEKKQLSYHVENTLKADCLVDYGGPPPDECENCLAYSFGKTTNIAPGWWQE